MSDTVTISLSAKIAPDDYQALHEMIGDGCVGLARALYPEERKALPEGHDRGLAFDMGDEWEVVSWGDADLADMLMSVVEVAPDSEYAEMVIGGVAAGFADGGPFDLGEIDTDVACVMVQTWKWGEVVFG